jgi:hypothetical protein
VGLGYRCEGPSQEADLQAKDSIFERPWTRLGEGENDFLRQLFDLAEAVNYEGNFLPASDRFVGHDLSGSHFADLRISGCLEWANTPNNEWRD